MSSCAVGRWRVVGTRPMIPVMPLMPFMRSSRSSSAAASASARAAAAVACLARSRALAARLLASAPSLACASSSRSLRSRSTDATSTKKSSVASRGPSSVRGGGSTRGGSPRLWTTCEPRCTGKMASASCGVAMPLHSRLQRWCANQLRMPSMPRSDGPNVWPREWTAHSLRRPPEPLRPQSRTSPPVLA